MPPAPAEKAQKKKVLRAAGKQRPLFAVDRPPEHNAEQKPAELRKDREVVAGGKAGIENAKWEEPSDLKDHALKQIAHDDADGGDGADGCGRQLLKEGIEHHADAEQMQHAEFHNDIRACHMEQIHAPRHKRNEHPTCEHQRTAPEAPGAERCAAAGEYDEDRAAVLLNEGIQRRKMKLLPEEKAQIEHEMNEDHAENAEAAQSVQLPDAFTFFRHIGLLNRCAGRKARTCRYRVIPVRRRPAQPDAPPLPPRGRGRRPCRPASWEAPCGTQCHTALRIWRSGRGSSRTAPA